MKAEKVDRIIFAIIRPEVVRESAQDIIDSCESTVGICEGCGEEKPLMENQMFDVCQECLDEAKAEAFLEGEFYCDGGFYYEPEADI